MPPTTILTEFDAGKAKTILEGCHDGYVLKFVSDYGKKYPGSETGRVRFSGETLSDTDEALAFLKDSIEVAGKAVVQAKISGREFSANYAVDANGHLFRLGENVCFKRRNDGNTGPICDGTGSITIGNTLPFLDEKDIRFIEERIVKTFHAHVTEDAVHFLNVDGMKADDGPSSCSKSTAAKRRPHHGKLAFRPPESDQRRAYDTQDGTPTDHTQLPGASTVVSAFAPYFPGGTTDDRLMTLEVTKRIPDDIEIITGWVDVLRQDEETRLLRIQNSPALLFEHRNTTLAAAHARLYEALSEIIRGRLDYRKDIGGNHDETG